MSWHFDERDRSLGVRRGSGRPGVSDRITSEGAREDRERALNLGANQYLTKPIQANRVLAVARGLLEKD